MSGIECGSTGRYFGNLEAIEECCKSHNRCTACPYKHNQSNTEIHFIAKDNNSLTQRELNKLMDDINKHLKARQLAVPQSVSLPRGQNIVRQTYHIAKQPQPVTQFRSKHKGKGMYWLWIALLLFALALIITTLIRYQAGL